MTAPPPAPVSGPASDDGGAEPARVAPAPAEAGFKGLCPRCGAPTLFAGYASFADRCTGCGLDLAAFNVGDGPAAFLTLGIGTIVTILAITLELALSPPWWLHVLLWLPLTAVGVLWSLRIAKGVLVALEYRNAAGEARSGGR